MKIVSKNEFRTFAKKYFPGKPIVYEDKYAYIQAGSSLGTYLHYECTETYVTLHIEGPNWRPIRDYLKSNLSNKRLTPSWWDRQNCQWTIDNEIHTADDLFQAFLDIRAIIEPVIERFEGKEPQDYTHYVLSKAEDNTPTPTEEIKEEKVAEKETKTTAETSEKKVEPQLAEKQAEPTVKITPIKLPPITVERTIDELGITLTKTYDKLAEAPIQGVDAAGRRTKEVLIPKLPELKLKGTIALDDKFDLTSDLHDFVRKCFQSIILPNPLTSYEAQFWKYLSSQDPSQFYIETGYELKSTFGVLSVIPTFEYTISVANETTESCEPTFYFDKNYSESNIAAEDLVALFTYKDADEVHDDLIIFSSHKFNNIQTILGNYKTPRSFDNSCPDCKGEKKIRCHNCGGSGREQYEEGEYADGRPKIKTGQCSECYGRGYFVCKTCNETGKVDQGTGMIQILESTINKLKLKSKISVSNSFFSTTTNIVSKFQAIQKQVRELEENKNDVQIFKNRLRKECYDLYEVIEEDDKQYVFSNFMDHIGVRAHHRDFSNLDHVEALINTIEALGWSYSSNIKKLLNRVKSLNKSNDELEKQLNCQFENLLEVKNVEVIFKNQLEIAFNNFHKNLQFNSIPKEKIDFLYEQNLEKVLSILKLENPNERILGILENHEIENYLLKITIPIEEDKTFAIYYSQNENELFYHETLPKIEYVNDKVKEEEIRVKKLKEEEEIRAKKSREEKIQKEKQRLEEERRKAKEKYKQHYSQSFENLLDTKPTKKVGVLSKLFRSESYKKSIDAEKTIKLMIYMAKADGKLSLQEKEYLTNNILQTFKEGYTSENRQQFIDLLNSKSLLGLTQDDVTFSSPNELNIALDKLVKLAKYDGEVTSEERTLLEKIAIMTSSEDYLKKKYNNIF